MRRRAARQTGSLTVAATIIMIKIDHVTHCAPHRVLELNPDAAEEEGLTEINGTGRGCAGVDRASPTPVRLLTLEL